MQARDKLMQSESESGKINLHLWQSHLENYSMPKIKDEIITKTIC